MYKHILLATDLSEQTKVVATRGKELAESFRCKLSIVHVIEYTPLAYAANDFVVPAETELLAIFEKMAREKLHSLAAELNIPETQRYLEIPPLATTIVELAEKISADLLVIGSHGRHGVRLLLGSTANSVLHVAKCDVLAVRLK